MTHQVYEILPVFAAVLFAGAAVIMAMPVRTLNGGWRLPALLSALLLAWSIWTVAQQGAGAVWTEHTRNAWGNQIWFDLLLATGLGLALLIPRARIVGMRPFPWVALVACTGSIGLFAMMARCLFLEDRRSGPAKNSP